MLETPKASVVLPEALYVSKNVTAWDRGGGAALSPQALEQIVLFISRGGRN